MTPEELRRIVARHGRNLDAVEPRRPLREEIPLAAAGSRGELSARPAPRNDVGSFAPAARRTHSASRSSSAARR